MTKILGIDTGTNSLGWAIVEKVDGSYKLLDKGVHIFSEGVKKEQGKESSKAAEKTTCKSVRKKYWRRKVRRISLLRILIENNLCPFLSNESLKDWRKNNIYPQDEAFIAWQRTDDNVNENPYKFRYMCLTHKLDLSDLTQRYILGRALYHLNQRRGFHSNRNEETNSNDGQVKNGITDLTTDIEAAECKYLGEYFYLLYQKGEKIRNHYTDREEHYEKEFCAICAKQELDNELVVKLKKTIFDQRSPKSQKGQVGKCKFENKKSRCPSSHPLYEDFKMYQLINSIKIQTPADTVERSLTIEEKDKIIPLFKRKTKNTFAFEDIAKKLAGKNKYCYSKDGSDKPYKFNYQMDFMVAGSVVNAQLKNIFGEDWLGAVCEIYTKAKGKTPLQIMNDIWHSLFFYKDKEKLKGFAMTRLQLDEEQAAKYSEIYLPKGYASLSLKAISKILPYMRDYGLSYAHAVFLANLKNVLPQHIWGIKETREAAIELLITLMNFYDKNRENRGLEQCIKEFLAERYNVSDSKLKNLYHPSMMESYSRVSPNEDGIYQLGSPRIGSVKNPMAMHSLFRLRSVINLLLKEGKIDPDTIVHIELARELNDSNRRKAIQTWQKEQEADRKTCVKKIKDLKLGIENPTDTDILKYQLWEEQKHICLYTGDEIAPKDFLCKNPKYDIEHTIPRSAGGDSSKMNLTLCSSEYNRDVKKTKLPVQLADYEKILECIKEWKERYEKLDERIRKISTRGIVLKKEKDEKIQLRHKLSLERDYWRGKYQRFTMESVPEGFSSRQGIDAGVISSYARKYLKSVFKHVNVIQGLATSDFRKMWEIQDEYTKKERVNHVHHCIDAIIIACIGKREYDKLAQFYHDEDEYKWNRGTKPKFDKPWSTFVHDIKHIQDELLVAHYYKDNVPKHTQRNLRDNKGVCVKDKNKHKILMKGDTARGSLHNDTHYGAINKDDTIIFVVRKSLDKMEEKDVKNIIDEKVRCKVEDAISLHGSLKEALKAGIWMNEDKQIPIKKVRIKAHITNPIKIRHHRDVSKHEYKRHYYVDNKNNYMMAIYIGSNEKGQEKRDIEPVNMMKAATYYKKSNYKESSIVPLRSSRYRLPLAYKLYIGQMVILYDKNPKEVWEADMKYRQSRLYKIVKIEKNGRIELVHHQEARPAKDLKPLTAAYDYDGALKPRMRISYSKFKALTQGRDFEINDLGEIRML